MTGAQLPSTDHTIVNPEVLPRPSGYAHGVRAGNTVYLGGQTALDKDMKIVPGGIVAQFEQAFSNVLVTLREAGGQPQDLVSVTIYLTDVDDYMSNGREIGRLWRSMAGSDYPAMAGIGVSRLWQTDALIEIQGVAVIPDHRA
ncbi:RidA family protein [Brevibacterium casei]|uniref:Putative endoribonuclease L-PSP family protein n=3 Tax=Bacteria TaxID=2 RepID=K9AIZ7_9MICO|nr:RidA family protein [Brevibacterium casei]NJE66679.1 RidA family protein [Brevibacterium sp. LS14]EKU47293.1 putative endoribonuclease L-PSP family protein [Brevibacterium casei S18]MCT1764651.1 RidA family protein [Brevibacterium casei]MCT2357646.1 RidA family protein [Brevibacterium casei]QQT69419.1 RidA family protein [Brevibacterium casei]